MFQQVPSASTLGWAEKGRTGEVRPPRDELAGFQGLRIEFQRRAPPPRVP